MKVKSIVFRVFLLGCSVLVITMLMGMMKEKSMAQQFAEIRQNLPKEVGVNTNFKPFFDAVQISLEQRQPNFSEAFQVLETMKEGPLKNMSFNTDFGTLSGADIINIYFGDFINKLGDKIISAPMPAKVKSSEKPIQNNLSQKFAELLNELPESGENISLLRKPLMIVQNMLLQSQPNLNEALTALQKIKQSDFLKKKQFSTPLLGTVTGEQIFTIYFDDFMKMLERQIQASQPHNAGQPYGLINKQNSCFMNSAIQSLASLEKATNLLLKQTAHYYLPKSISALYVQLLQTMQTQREAVIDPLPFCLQGWKLIPGTQIGEQQDAAEFVQLLLHELTKGKDINPIGNPQGINKDLLSLFEVKILQATYDENAKRTRQESLGSPVVPALAITPTDKTLLDCLKGYFGIHQHPDPAQANKKVVTALGNVSNYFLIRLLRTGYSQDLKAPFKNEQAISFELDNFDISSLSLTAVKFPLYRCKAFIAHTGSANVGHYIAYIRINNNWYICDDTSVTAVDTNKVQNFAQVGVTESVYGSNFTPVMFFYEQQ